MAIFHNSIKIVSRGKGKSAVASAAYRSGEKITNEYDGETHDYTRKGGIAFTGILLPDHAPREYADRSTLWNAVELVEKSKNAQLAREVEVSIPIEIPKSQWVRLMADYCKSNFVSKGMIADFCIHDKEDGNPHCHILLTMRPLKENGKWGAKCKKVYDLDMGGQRIKLASGNWKSHKEDTTDWNSQDNAELWRANWSEHCNLYLEKLGQTERIDHRSYERQGVDKIPTVHLGATASQMERKGIATDRGNINRQAIADNKELRATRARITRLMKWQRELKSQPLDLTQTGFKASVMDKLRTNKSVVGNRYQTMRELKQYASVWNFLQKHDIDNVEDFMHKITDMNESFYALQREVKANDTAITNLENRMELWQEYDKLKPLRKQYQSLKGRAKEQFYSKHSKDLDRAETLHQKWSDFVDSGKKINVRNWKSEISSLQNANNLCKWKMKALKDEIGSAEKIKKTLDELMASQPRKEHISEKDKDSR